MVEDQMPRPEGSFRTPEHSAQPERNSEAPVNFRSRRGEVTGITVGGVVQKEPAAILEAANRFIHETVGTKTKKADLSTEASIRSEYRTAREVSDFLPALLAYLQKESFRFQADDLNKLTQVEAKIQYLSERLTNILVHLDEVLWKKRNEAKATQTLRRDRLSTTTLRAMGRAAKSAPYIAAALSYVLAPVASASNGGGQDNRPPVIESDYRDAAAHEREESETEQLKLFTNIRNIEVYVDALEMAVKEVLGDAFEAVLDGSDPDLDIETDVELGRLEQEIPQNSFDIPVFTLDTETSANVRSALDGLPETGTSAPLPEDFVSNREVVNGYFGNNPELARQINNQYEALTQFRSLNGNGEILLIVRPAGGEQIMVSTVIKITQEFTDPATGITYTPDSLYGNAQNFMLDIDRKEVFGLESTPMAVIVTEEMAQSMPNPVGTLALLDRSDEGKIIAIQTEAGKRVFLDFTANSENPVNLRQDTSTSGTPLATVNSYTLVRGKAPEGAYNGPDDIIFKDGNGMVWVRASALNENGQPVEGWVSTSVVELKATPMPEAAATPDISSEVGEDVDLTSTEDPNDDAGEDGNDDDGGDDGVGEEVLNPDVNEVFGTATPDAVTQRTFDPLIGGYVEDRNGSSYVYREIVGADVEVTDMFMAGKIPVTIERIEGEDSFEFAENMRENGSEGFGQIFIELYKKEYEVDDATAQRMLLEDREVSLHVLKDARDFANSSRLNTNNSVVQRVRPSSGFSILVTKNLPYPNTPDNIAFDNTFATLAWAQNPDDSRGATISYGTAMRVTKEGRIVLVIGSQTKEESLSDLVWTNYLINGFDFVIRSAGRQGPGNSATPNPPQRTDYVKTMDETKRVSEKFDIPLTEESRTMSIGDWEELVLLNSDE